MKNLHVPLPDDVYRNLRRAADSTHVPATAIAREAIAQWLQQQIRRARHEAIASYAAKNAGAALDLDVALEAAATDHLLQRRKARK